MEQNDSRNTFLLTHENADWLVYERTPSGTWKPLYLFTLVPRGLEDFAEISRYHKSSSESPSTRGRFRPSATAGGRMTISGGRFIETQQGKGTERKQEEHTSQPQ